MPNDLKYLFVSYAREDAPAVNFISHKVNDEFRLRSLSVEVWIDQEYLRPGQRWEVEISRALEDSIGILVFVSPRSIKSDWIRRELEAVLTKGDRLIIPVILKEVPLAELPSTLASRQWINLSRRRTEAALRSAVKEIVDATERYLKSDRTRPPISSATVPQLAAEIAQETRGIRVETDPKPGLPDSVFVVHGHNPQALIEVESYLKSLGIKVTVLSRIAGPSQSLLQRFFQFSKDTRFAVVILTADDLGSSRHQYEAKGVGDRALQFRARQNVILELGFFYGFLGWEKVFVVTLPPDKVFPNFEMPSDLDGVVFDVIDNEGSWRQSLTSKLAQAGFRVSANDDADSEAHKA